MRNGFEILVLSYSSTRFEQCEWQKQKKYFNTFNFGVVVAWPSGQRLHLFAGGSWVQLYSYPCVATSFFFKWFFTFWLCTVPPAWLLLFFSFHSFFTLWVCTVYSHC